MSRAFLIAFFLVTVIFSLPPSVSAQVEATSTPISTSSATTVDPLATRFPIPTEYHTQNTLSLRIDGISTYTPACGSTTNTTTNSRSISYDDLTAQNFKNAAQKLSISSSANYGYVVTISQSDQLGFEGQPCPGADALNNAACVPDVVANQISPIAAGSWTDPLTQKGYGYSLEKITADTGFTVGFNFQSDRGPERYRQLPDLSYSELPAAIFRSNSATQVQGDQGYVCYRLAAPDEHLNTNYQHQINYLVTATF